MNKTSTVAPILGGGWTELQPNAAINAADMAIAIESNETGRNINLLEVDSAQQQSVAGQNYRLSMTVLDNGAVENVSANLWSQSWLHQATLSSWNEKPASIQAQTTLIIQAMSSLGLQPAITALPGSNLTVTQAMLANLTMVANPHH